ncbi:MAG: sigma-70 family RNA polymerase sigma factor [Nitrospinota bacterium]
MRKKEFEELALPHIDSLYNFALKLTGNVTEAEDLVQETYLKAYRFFHKYKKNTYIKAWLFRILKNTFINIYRRKKKEPEKIDFNSVEKFIDQLTDTNSSIFKDDISNDMLKDILNDEVKLAVDALPEEFRTVILLFDIEGFSYQEIAGILGCPVGTVMSRLHRGRKILYKNLTDYAKERGIL